MPRKKNAAPKIESEIAFIEPPAPDEGTIPEPKEHFQLPARFGAAPVDEAPLGWEVETRRREFKVTKFQHAYPTIRLPFQEVQRVEFGHNDQYLAENEKDRKLRELFPTSANRLFYTRAGIFYNQGQLCTAGSRVLVERSILDQFQTMLVEAVQKVKVGDGLAEGAQMGPLVSEEQLTRVLGYYVEQGKADGATLSTGEAALTARLFHVPHRFHHREPEQRDCARRNFWPGRHPHPLRLRRACHRHRQQFGLWPGGRGVDADSVDRTERFVWGLIQTIDKS